MAYSIVQGGTLTGSGSATPTTAVAWTSAPTNGNLLVVVLTFRTTGTTSEATSQGWTKGPVASSTTTISRQTEIWYRVAGAGETTAGPTFNLPSAVAYDIAQAEVSGFTGTPTLDQTGTGSNDLTAGLTVTVGSTITAGSEFIFGAGGAAVGNTSGLTWSASTAGGSATFGADIATINPPKNGDGVRDNWATSGASGTSPSITFNFSATTTLHLSCAIATFKGVVAAATAGTITQGVRRQNYNRAKYGLAAGAVGASVSWPQLFRPIYNSGSRAPVRNVVRHPFIPPRVQPSYRMPVPYAQGSGGTTPTRPIRRPTPQPLPRPLKPRLLIQPPPVAAVAPKVTAVRHPFTPPRVRPRLLSPTFNSGGSVPRFTQGKFWPRIRPTPAQRFTPSYNSGGIAPRTITTRRPWRFPSLLSRRVVPPPIVAAAAVTPLVLVARHPFTPPRVRPRSFTPTFNSGGSVPRFTQGVRRNNFVRPASRQLPALTFNSGGLTPKVIPGVKRGIAKPVSPRSFQPSYNSGGIQPPIATIVRHPLRWRPVSPQGIRPSYNSGGRAPSVSVTRHPWRFPALRSRLVIPPPVVAVAAVAPLVSIVRHPFQLLRVRPQRFTPVYNSGGIAPKFSQGKFWPRVKPSSPQNLRPVFNSGGRTPTITSVRHPFQLKPVPPRGIRPAVGAAPPAAQVMVVRHPLRWRPIGPQSIRPGYNSGGISPAVNRGKSWPRVRPTSPQSLRPLYNSGGLLPRVSAGVKRLAVKLKLPRWIPGLLPPVITGPGSVQVQLWDAFPVAVEFSEPFSAIAATFETFPVAVEFTEPFSAMAATLEAFSVAVELSDIFGGSMAWYVGKAVRIANWGGPNTANASGGFRNASGVLYDPTTPSLKYILPGGTVQTVSGGALTKDAVGLYSYIVTPTQDGDALATFISNDGAYADPIAFKIEKAPL